MAKRAGGESMAMRKAVPQHVYKYRAFGASTVESLVADLVYFADPSTFNDPLDTRPTVQADLGISELEQVLRELIDRRVQAELLAAAKSVSYRGPKTSAQVERLARNRAMDTLHQLKYLKDDPDAGPSPFTTHEWMLRGDIENELLKRYGKGILSLAASYSNPLMWSHYGDQHKGLCIGYSVPREAQDNLFKVSYRGSRIVKVSTIRDMLAGVSGSQQALDAAVLLRKAEDWKYEEEWRLLGPRGAQRSPIELTDVTFGMRCPGSVKYAIVSSLKPRDRAVEFFEMRAVHGTFKLKRVFLDCDDLASGFPARSLGLLDGFDVVEEQVPDRE